MSPEASTFSVPTLSTLLGATFVVEGRPLKNGLFIIFLGENPEISQFFKIAKAVSIYVFHASTIFRIRRLNFRRFFVFLTNFQQFFFDFTQNTSILDGIRRCFRGVFFTPKFSAVSQNTPSPLTLRPPTHGIALITCTAIQINFSF